MKSVNFQKFYRKNTSGAVLLIMVLLIVVLGVLFWFDPFILFSEKDPNLPWNQMDRIVKRSEKVPAPSKDQPSITKPLEFKADAKIGDEKRGKIVMVLGTDGRIEGGWTGEFYPRSNVHYQLMGCEFEGNIDPSKIYEDQTGQDTSKLSFITKGWFIILETDYDTGKVRKVQGYIYLTGWLDNEYNAQADVTVTSDKKSYKTFSWRAKGQDASDALDFFKRLKGASTGGNLKDNFKRVVISSEL